MTPQPLYPDTTLIVAPVYAGTVDLYARMSLYGSVAFDRTSSWDKRRKESHRTTIGGANGSQRLTVPIVKPEHYHSATIGDIRVSDHGHWWDLHRGALESAYGRTPYYEFYADRLLPAFTGKVENLFDLDMMIHLFVCDVLGINDVSDRLPSVGTTATLAEAQEVAASLPYWQVWSERFGFQPGLSILDLIFSEGPAAAIYLHNVTAHLR